MIQSQDPAFSSYAFPPLLARTEPKVLPALQASFLLFVVSMPIEAASSLFTNQYFSLAKSAGILLFLMALTQVSLVFRRIPKVIWWFGLYYVVFCILAFAGVPEDLPPAMIRASQLIQLFLLFVIAFNLFRSVKLLILTIKTTIYTVCALSLMEMLGIGRNQDATSGRVTAFNQNGNVWGAIVAISLILLIGMTLRPEARGHRKVSVLIFGILTIELLRTGSRSSTGALLGSVMLFLLQGESFGRKVKTWLVTGCALALVVAGAMELEADRWIAAEKGNLSGRELIAPTALHMFIEKPFFGWGPVTHLRELGERVYGIPLLDTHNLILWVLTEVGFIGALPFLVGWALCLILAWKARKGRFGMMPLAANICFFLVNQGNTVHNLKLFWVILAMGAAYGTHRIYQEPNPPQRLLVQKFRPISGGVGVRA